LVKQAIEFGLKKDMKIFLTISEITVAEGVSPGSYEDMYCGLTFYWEIQDRYPKAREFVEAFQGRGRRPPTAYASSSYEVTHLLLDGINKAGTLDPEKVIAKLEGSTFQYTKGPQTIRPCDHAPLGEFFVCRGRAAGQMKGKWDFFQVEATTHGKDNIPSCKDLGFKA
jgi:ABC-type branched-subunit amino acid transport system substrate-binding protein